MSPICTQSSPRRRRQNGARVAGNSRIQKQAHGHQPVAGPSGQLGAFSDLGAKFQPAGIVHVQYFDGGAPGGADADDARAFEDEMVGPSITPRMKQRGDWWQANARLSTSSEPPCCFAMMCSNMMPQVAMFLVQTAILATVASPPAD